MYIYLCIVNLAALLCMGLDKLLAKWQTRRIPERILLMFAFIFGSVGVLGGMYLFRHKTRKPKFYIAVPIILAVQLGLFIFLKNA
ncbi:MAG: DUF1294 domain-containing protein [Oscillospiraceae bacterium]|nr:DUF1294 domain-containing protein [Oscillospiraceae bacterium]